MDDDFELVCDFGEIDQIKLILVFLYFQQIEFVGLQSYAMLVIISELHKIFNLSCLILTTTAADFKRVAATQNWLEG